MPDTHKPLFNRHLIKARMVGFELKLTDRQREIVRNWAGTASSPAFMREKEKPHQGEFLLQLFGELLDYHLYVGHADGYHLKAETASNETKGSKTPDGTLGFYGGESDCTRAVIELKAPAVDLDLKQQGHGGLTPVEQGFGYVPKFDGCRWVIVSDFVTIRLYSSARGQAYCHEWTTAELADEETLREFVFLLQRDRLISQSSAPSFTEKLASDTHTQEEKITKEFYAFYKGVRLRLFHQLVRDNPAPDGTASADHEVHLLEKAQKILDRVLFVCFCEDKGLLPHGVIRKAIEAADGAGGFVRTSRWQQVTGLFHAIDKGSPPLGINGYNGGLFAEDPALDKLIVSDETLDDCLRLSDYDFDTDLNVNILGHIFEQSISDLENLRADIQGESIDRTKSKRKKEGVFYTPEYITRFIVENTIGTWLQERFEELNRKHDPDSIPDSHHKKKQEALLALWSDYQAVLERIKVLDPACGSGAFLVAAFDYLHAEFQRANDQLAALGRGRLFDLDRQILQENLFGVDLNAESVEITKLSLWLKTANRDKPLNNLDGNIKWGNSLIDSDTGSDNPALALAYGNLPAEVKQRAFEWRKEFPQVFEQGGFDCVIGNPPYVRQELLSPIKPYLERQYASYHGTADLYVYFYEKGVKLLKVGGKMSYIVTNKWLRSGYGEPLRKFFSEKAVFEKIVDFGHAPIFEDADTFPCIVILRRPDKQTENKPEPDAPVILCPIPREELNTDAINQHVQEQGYAAPWSRFTEKAWSLEPPTVDLLMHKIRCIANDLSAFAGTKPIYGVKTGFNEAFLIDDACYQLLVQQDPNSAEIIKPYLRGQDVRRWHSEWCNLWMIATAHHVDIQRYPAVVRHLEQYRKQLEQRAGKQEWWQLQSTLGNHTEFDKPKLIYQEIQFLSRYAYDDSGTYGNNKTFILPTGDLYLLACLNSPLIWWYCWRYLPHMKDEAYSPSGFLMEKLPIAEPTAETRDSVEVSAAKLIQIAKSNQREQREILDWLRIEHGIETPGQKLEDFASLDADAFCAEAKKRKPKGSGRLTPASLAELKHTFIDAATPIRERRTEALKLERTVSDLVNQAYNLTPEEIDLMWRTAPPRMPVQNKVI